MVERRRERWEEEVGEEEVGAEGQLRRWIVALTGGQCWAWKVEQQ